MRRVREVHWRAWGTAWLLLALLGLLAACGGAEPTADAVPTTTVTVPPNTLDAEQAPEPGVLRLGLTPTPGAALVRLAAARGLFAEQGLPTRLIAERDDAAVAADLAAGAIDGATVATDAAIAMRADGVPIRIVLLLDQSTVADAIVGGPEVRSLEDLVGQRVAYAPGSRGELLLRAALAEAGLEWASIDPVAVTGLAPGAVLARGDVAAAAVSEPALGELLEAEEAPYELLFASGDMPGVLAEVLVVREEVAELRPGQMLALVRAWAAAVRLERAEGDLVRDDLAGRIPEAGDAVATRLAGTIFYDLPANAVELLPGGRFYDRTIGETSAIAVDLGLIAGPVDSGEILDGRFAQAVAIAG